MTSLPAASAYMAIRETLLRHAPMHFDVDKHLDEFEAGIRRDERAQQAQKTWIRVRANMTTEQVKLLEDELRTRCVR